MNKYLEIAKQGFEIESKAILNLSNKLPSDFEKIIKCLLNCTSKVIVTGIGKSGHVAKKIAATLSSTGTPSFFLHPAEAFHGDLGMISPTDIILALSYSGETDEVLKILPFLKNNGNKIISLTGNPQSTLGRNSDFNLNIEVEKEVCPLDLAPTTSTTCQMAMGDILALCLMRARNFKTEDYARFHPGGSLGRRLLTRVKDVMKSSSLPIVQLNSNMIEIIDEISKARMGIAIVLEFNNIVGVITDGDIRRNLANNLDRFSKLFARDIMSKNPKLISYKSKISEAEKMMSEYKIHSLIVVDDNNKFIGVVELYDVTYS
jgi:arabinose-5-phosphate isomerase